MRFEVYYTGLEQGERLLFKSLDSYSWTDEGDLLRKDSNSNGWSQVKRRGDLLIWREDADYLELY